jgi:predicted permease
VRTLLFDLKNAVRLVARSPRFVLAVVATLGLGIGANTAMFTVLDQVLLRPLPVPEPGRLVVLDSPGPDTGSFEVSSDFSTVFSYPLYRDLRDASRDSVALLARFLTSADLAAGDEPRRVATEIVSGNYFEVLGVGAVLGRVLSAEDDRERLGHPVAVLSHGFWADRFGADPGVVGRVVRLNGHPFTVVGVAARAFHGIEVGRATDVFVPMAMKTRITPTWDGMDSRRMMWLNVMGRLGSGSSTERAAAAAGLVYRRLREAEAAEMPERSADFKRRFVERPLVFAPGGRGRGDLRAQFHTELVVLMGMVGLVLLIACANVANLLGARALSRQREIAVRLALGASRGRLVAQLVAEGLVLASLGGALGLALSYWTTGALLAALPVGSGSHGMSAAPDLRVLLFTFGVSLLSSLLFGLAPALHASRASLVGTLRDEAGSLAGAKGATRLRRGLVVAEIALSLLLLVGAGLFARSLHNLRRLDPGFDPRPLVTFSVDPARAGYSTEETQRLVARLRDELAALSGVRSATAAEISILTNSTSSSSLTVQGYTPDPDERVAAELNFVAPSFFETLGLPVLRGRPLDARDGPDAPRVAVVNESLAKRYFGGEEALGRRFGFGRRGQAGEIEIVGVVRDGRHESLRDGVPLMAYVPHAQYTDRTGGAAFYLKAAGDPGALGSAVRAAVRRVAPALPVNDLRTMASVVDESLFLDRLSSWLSAAFGLLATLLAATGLYAVTAFSVARRTREIGVRMALGANARAVLGLVLRDVAQMAVVGIAFGLPLAVALGRLFESRLVGLRAADPATLSCATLVLAVVVLLAGYVPARRATRVDPMVALRFE